jgi:poly(A) polymerase
VSYELALQLVKTLFKAGFTAYFAGGWVRDWLLGKESSEEIDIATSAPPHIIQQLFSKTVPVGLAFGVVIVVLEGKNFEVTTFRKDHPYADGRHPSAVDFSTAEKDAHRRDFTINGMFYDPLSATLLDYVGGQEDLKKRVIRAIGDPAARFAEDRLRMMRAVRFAARLGFRIEEETEKAIIRFASYLFPAVSIERIWQELNKMRATAHFDYALALMHRFGLLQTIFPQLASLSREELTQKIASFPYFPLHCPTIAYLLELFPDMPLGERLLLCRYLKTTREDLHLTQFLTEASLFLKKPFIEKVEWAHFYAHPHSALFLQIQAAKLQPVERVPFVATHEERQRSLAPHIEHIQKRRPILTAAYLKEHGIAPGKEMGLLLKEAERIAVNENLTNPKALLLRLRHSPLWISGHGGIVSYNQILRRIYFSKNPR